MSTRTLLTGEDLWKIVANGSRYELSRGELVAMTPVGIRHLAVVSNVQRVLDHYVREKNLGLVGPEGGFYLSRNPDTLRAPDVAFISKERLEKSGGIPEKFAEFPPDLAVEVLSPADTVSEVQRKVEEYLAGGVPLVWIVDPVNQKVTVYRSLQDIQILSADQELTGDPTLPGFRVPVARFFAA
jgi:Uma2 family endonuclease